MFSKGLIAIFLMTLQATALSLLLRISGSTGTSQLVCGVWIWPRQGQRLSPGLNSNFHKRLQPKIKLYCSGSKSKAPNTRYFEIPGF